MSTPDATPADATQRSVWPLPYWPTLFPGRHAVGGCGSQGVEHVDSALVKVPVGDPDGDFVVVEVDHAMLEEDQVILASSQPAQAVVKASESLERSLDRIIAAVGGALVRLRSLPETVDATEIEFGLKIGGEVGLVVARGTTDVNFRVKLSWEKRSA
jgi:hypothetical protein